MLTNMAVKQYSWTELSTTGYFDICNIADIEQFESRFVIWMIFLIR